jgi:hypothetical protein
MRSSHTSSITTAAYRLTSKWFVSIGPRLVNSKWVVASLVLSPDRFGIASGRARLEPGIRTDGPAKAGGVLGIASGFPRYRPRLAPDKIRSKSGCLRFEVGQSPDILRFKNHERQDAGNVAGGVSGHSGLRVRQRPWDRAGYLSLRAFRAWLPHCRTPHGALVHFS